MPIQHVNRRGKTYYLHRATTKTGKSKYFFSMKTQGALVDTLPDGFEIYEHPNTQVFLRRISDRIVTDDEISIVKNGMKRHSRVEYYQIDVKKDTITVYVADQDVDGLLNVLGLASRRRSKDVQDLVTRFVSYSPMLRFILIDESSRIFAAERFCYLGSIDDWIEIGEPDTLGELIKTYLKHLGQDSYYGLM